MVVPLLIELFDDIKDEFDKNRRQAHGRFIEHQQFRVEHQAAGNGQHLLLPAGKRAAQLIDTLLEAGKERETMFHPLFDDCRSLTVRPPFPGFP
jgi:hypothetical protein